MEIYVKVSMISIFYLFFLVLNHDVVIYIDFTHVAASDTANDVNVVVLPMMHSTLRCDKTRRFVTVKLYAARVVGACTESQLRECGPKQPKREALAADDFALFCK